MVRLKDSQWKEIMSTRYTDLNEYLQDVAVEKENTKVQNNVFHFCMKIDFDVPYFEDLSGLTEQELFDKVMEYVIEEREALVVNAKAAAIRLLDGDSIDA